ncbi:MAG: hypothetical protein NTW37_15940 [Proteobacteria bacterium]|jgi:hypothetical protein|nr:hypothetical protein [Pseudomonadota bacterium]
MNWPKIGFVALILFGALNGWSGREVSQPPGVTAGGLPTQVSVSDEREFERNGYRIRALARFEVSARVLGAEHYRFDREAQLAPVDLALGWGRMSDTTVLQRISISQRGRFYYWSTADFPIPRREIETSSANMHMIPADDRVEAALKSVRPGQIVTVRGYLVEARAPDGWRWRSSMTREDTGAGACELIWVESVSMI